LIKLIYFLNESLFKFEEIIVSQLLEVEVILVSKNKVHVCVLRLAWLSLHFFLLLISLDDCPLDVYGGGLDANKLIDEAFICLLHSKRSDKVHRSIKQEEPFNLTNLDVLIPKVHWRISLDACFLRLTLNQPTGLVLFQKLIQNVTRVVSLCKLILYGSKHHFKSLDHIKRL
jgi:hypothetical protein